MRLGGPQNWYGRRKKNSVACVRKSELYRQSDSRLSAKLVPTFEDRCQVVSVTDPYGRILGFLDRYGRCEQKKINLPCREWEVDCSVP
jgi:hypothetical protein